MVELRRDRGVILPVMLVRGVFVQNECNYRTLRRDWFCERDNKLTLEVLESSGAELTFHNRRYTTTYRELQESLSKKAGNKITHAHTQSK